MRSFVIAAAAASWAALASAQAQAQEVDDAAPGIGAWIAGDTLAIRAPREPDIRPALRALLRDRSHVMIDYGLTGEVRRLEVLLLSPPGAPPRTLATAAAPQDVATAESVSGLLATAFASAPAGERAPAVEAMGYATEAEAEQADAALAHLLSDPDPAVRARALETLKDTADEVPFDRLAQMAREDSSVEVRVQALELLVERSEGNEAAEALRAAVNDPLPAIRKRARELALDWHVPLGG